MSSSLTRDASRTNAFVSVDKSKVIVSLIPDALQTIAFVFVNTLEAIASLTITWIQGQCFVVPSCFVHPLLPWHGLSCKNCFRAGKVHRFVAGRECLFNSSVRRKRGIPFQAENVSRILFGLGHSLNSFQVGNVFEFFCRQFINDESCEIIRHAITNDASAIKVNA